MVLQRHPYRAVVWGYGPTNTPNKDIVLTLTNDKDDNVTVYTTQVEEQGQYSRSKRKSKSLLNVDAMVIVKNISFKSVAQSIVTYPHCYYYLTGGKWRVLLDPVSEAGPFTITVEVKGESAQILKLNDVMFGDVWLCAGQRNMEFPVSMVGVMRHSWHAMLLKHECIYSDKYIFDGSIDIYFDWLIDRLIDSWRRVREKSN